MRIDLKSIRKYMNGRNTEVTKAFVAGYCRAMSDCGYAVTGDSDPRQYVRQQILHEEALRYKQGWDEAEMICQTFGVPKVDFRAMMLDCIEVDDCGRELGLDGDPIKNPAEHRRYLMTDYIGVGEDCYEVAYVDLVNAAGDHYRVYKNNLPFISYLLWQDMMIGDPINERYVAEAQVGGMLEEYAYVIMSALRKCSHKWLTGNNAAHDALPEEAKATTAAKMCAMAERENPSLPHCSELKQWNPGDYQRLTPEKPALNCDNAALNSAIIDIMERAEAIARREQMSAESLNAMIYNVMVRACVELEDFERKLDNESEMLPDGTAVLPSGIPSENTAEDSKKTPKRRGRPKNDDVGKKTTGRKTSGKTKKGKKE